MDNLNEEVIELLREGRELEAVQRVHRHSGCTLQEAKLYVERLRKGIDARDLIHNIHSWEVKYKDGKVEQITFRNDFGTHTAVPGSPEWDYILEQARQAGSGRADPETPEREKSLWQRLIHGRRSGVLTYLAFALIPVLIILFVCPSRFGIHIREAYWGLALHVVTLIITTGLAYLCYATTLDKKERWYYRSGAAIMGIVIIFTLVVFGRELAMDLVENDVRTYEGTFLLKKHKHRKSPTDYIITWEDDTLSSRRGHNISYTHFKQLKDYRTVRITYWRHTGLVWTLEPLKEK